MAIRFRRVNRLFDLGNPNSGKKYYAQLVYKYDNPATLKEVANEISTQSGVSEGETISVLKDFRTLLKKNLLSGRSVNIDGLGYFYLAASSEGTDKFEDFTVSNINGLRICFRANNDIRIHTSGTTRSDGLTFKDLDRLGNNDSPSDDDQNGGNSGSGGDENDHPLG